MATLEKGVLFRSIRNCGNKGFKILLECDRERGVKKKRQYVLKNIGKWNKIEAFGEEKADVVRNTYNRVWRAKKEVDNERL